MDQATNLRTVALTERVATECRLARADVDFLLSEHRAHVEVIPAGRRGRYRLTPTGHVGTIVGPGCRLLIRPKIPVENLFYLLDPEADPPTVEDCTDVGPGAEALDFLAGRLGHLLAERGAAGLHRAYAERVDQGPFLQGRLDLPAQLRDPNGRKDRFHCCYEDFTADVPCNQVPKATAELVLQSPLLREGARAALRRSLAAFAGVSAAVLGPDSFQGILRDPLTQAYRPLLELCRLLADGLRPDGGAGPVPYPAFLIDMDRVFEHYLTRGVVRAFREKSRYTVSVQPLHAANRPAAGQPDIQMRPDLVVECDGRPVLVIDAKWKSLAGSPLVTADIYQVVAYGTALGVGRAVLVYPGRRDCLWEYPLARDTLTLEIREVRVVGSSAACGRSLDRLGRALARKSG